MKIAAALVMMMLVVGCAGESGVKFLAEPFPTPDDLISGQQAYISALSEVLGYASDIPIYRSEPLLTTRGEDMRAMDGDMAEPYASEIIWIVAFEFGDPVHIIRPAPVQCQSC